MNPVLVNKDPYDKLLDFDGLIILTHHITCLDRRGLNNIIPCV